MMVMVLETGGTLTPSRNVSPASTSFACTCLITLPRSSSILPLLIETAPFAFAGSSVSSATSWLCARRLTLSHSVWNSLDASSFSVTSVA